MSFTYDISDCDVLNQDVLKRYRELAASWIEILLGDKENSVSTQLADLFWHDAAWRSLNEARRISIADDRFITAPIIASLLDRGYLTGQVVAIGRLLERGSTNPRKQVLSIRRLVDEIMIHRDVFTREVFVAHDGLPYDWQATQRRLGFKEGVHWLPTVGPDAWTQSLLRHEEFDRLSKTTPDNRRREDRIHDSVFDGLLKGITDPIFDDIQALRHKSIAHAADAVSRADAKTLRRGLSLDEFAKAQFILLGLYQAISANLLYQSWSGAVPVPQYDQFEFLDKPIVSEAGLLELRSFWDRHCAERDDWLTKSYYDYITRPHETHRE